MDNFKSLVDLVGHRFAGGQSTHQIQKALVETLKVNPNEAVLIIRAAQIISDDRVASEADSQRVPTDISASAPPQ